MGNPSPSAWRVMPTWFREGPYGGSQPQGFQTTDEEAGMPVMQAVSVSRAADGAVAREGNAVKLDLMRRAVFRALQTVGGGA